MSWPRIRAAERAVVSKLSKLVYKDKMRDAFIRYARALDGADHDSSFLKLWGLLEFLTNTQSASYTETIKRALFLYGEHENRFHSLILSQLRDRRNSSVHGGNTSTKTEPRIYQLRRYVTRLFRFHLEYGASCKSMSGVQELLSFPRDISELKSKLALLRLGIKIRNEAALTYGTGSDTSFIAGLDG
jgi:hypothetical protein